MVLITNKDSSAWHPKTLLTILNTVTFLSVAEMTFAFLILTFFVVPTRHLILAFSIRLALVRTEYAFLVCLLSPLQALVVGQLAPSDIGRAFFYFSLFYEELIDCDCVQISTL